MKIERLRQFAKYLVKPMENSYFWKAEIPLKNVVKTKRNQLIFGPAPKIAKIHWNNKQKLLASGNLLNT